MQDLSDFALPCTVTQVLYNGPMYISPEEDLSSQIFNLGSVGSVLPSDLQGIQADDDGSRKLGLQTANGGRTDANPVAYPKKEGGLTPTDYGAKWSLYTGFIDIQWWEEVFEVEDRWCATVGRHFCRGRRGAFRNPGMPHPIVAAGARIDPR